MIWLPPLLIPTSNDRSVGTPMITIVTPVAMISPRLTVVQTALGKELITKSAQPLQTEWVVLAKTVSTIKELLLLDGVGGKRRITIKIILLKLY